MTSLRVDVFGWKIELPNLSELFDEDKTSLPQVAFEFLQEYSSLTTTRTRAILTDTLLPIHGTDAATFAKTFGAQYQGKHLIIAADNLKFFGLMSGDATTLGGVQPFEQVRTTMESGAPIVIMAFDHHNVLPQEEKGLVGAELVLKHQAVIASAVNHAIMNGYSITVVAHSIPFDPDSMISQFLIKEIISGRALSQGVHGKLVQYARTTDYYTFPFGGEQQLTLRGISDGLGMLNMSSPKLLAERSDRILRWLVDTSVDPGDPKAFGEFIRSVSDAPLHSEGSVERLVQQCVAAKLEALETAKRLVSFAQAYEVTLNTVGNSGEMVPVRYRALLVDNRGRAFKEIDDVLYSPDQRPTIIVKQDANGKWWVSMRPVKYNTGEGFASDPLLYSVEMPGNHVRGFLEQIVEKLVAFLPEGMWPTTWPFSAVAQQAPIKIEGHRIIEALFKDSNPVLIEPSVKIALPAELLDVRSVLSPLAAANIDMMKDPAAGLLGGGAKVVDLPGLAVDVLKASPVSSERSEATRRVVEKVEGVAGKVDVVARKAARGKGR